MRSAVNADGLFWTEWNESELVHKVYMNQPGGVRGTVGEFASVIAAMECVKACKRAYIQGWENAIADTFSRLPR